MALDSRFMISPSLQQLFRDKDTGEPLENGKVFFFRDVARTTLKTVYKLTGTPPNYTYTALPNPVILNGIGAFEDVIYYYPYIVDADGNLVVDLYYIEVYSESDVLQFTREAWPNFVQGSSSDAQGLYNYIPNGQFLSHIDIPGSNTLDPGEVPPGTGVVNVAYGGWTFERPISSTATDIIQFDRFGSWVANPIQSPRYAINVKCEAAGSDLFKDLRVKFNDVNKFASDTQMYTFFFTGKAKTGGNIPVNILIIKNFGAGGSTQNVQTIASFTLTPSYTTFPVAFVFGNNGPFIIGANNDDNVQIAIRFPTSSQFDADITDCGLFLGDVNNPIYTPETNSEFQYKGIAGWMDIPDYSHTDLYLTPILTPTGLGFDTSVIGSILFSSDENPPISYLRMDGQTSYQANQYSSDLIPYSRLATRLFNSTFNMPKYGTGPQFLTAFYTASTSVLNISTNIAGATTNASDGSSPTGFTITTPNPGMASVNLTSFIINTASTFGIKYNVTGSVFTGFVDGGNSGFTATELFPNLSNTYGVWTLDFVATPTASHFFTFNDTGPTFDYFYYIVDGVGADPTPSGGINGYPVSIFSTDSTAMNSLVTKSVVNGFQTTHIVVTGTPPAGSFFNIYSTTQHYAVWYSVDNVGPEPSVPGAILIEVSVNSSDTTAQIALKTQIAFNSAFFATPDARGAIPKIWNNGSSNDPNPLERYSITTALFGDNIGTYEFSSNLGHLHSGEGGANASLGIATHIVANVAPAGPPYTYQTSEDGQSDARPYNIYFNAFMKY